MSIYKNHPDFIPVDKEPSKAPFSFCSRKAETEKPEINPDWHSGRPSRGRVSDGETYRLVKASKSPTPPKPPVTGNILNIQWLRPSKRSLRKIDRLPKVRQGSMR